jgi:adenine specific DNA methylase Mod
MIKHVFELNRVLKDTGSFYLHCDWHASHSLKVMCDDIFEVTAILGMK